jgi:serine/threonine-protein kinase
MILPAGQIKLMDFGIAKILDDPTKSTNQNIKGTIIYMSPEQLNQEPVTKTADLYSLACITFEMLSGGLPWPVGGMGALMISMMNDAPRSLENLQVPQGAKLDPIFQKALAKDPTERYQSGQEFVAALQRVANENVQ